MSNGAAAVSLALLLLLPLGQTRPKSSKNSRDAIPVISVGNGALGGFGIADKIRRHFKYGKSKKKADETVTVKEEEEESTFIGDEVSTI